MKFLKHITICAGATLATACTADIDTPNIPETADMDSLIRMVPTLVSSENASRNAATLAGGAEIDAASFATRCPSLSVLIRSSYYYNEETTDEYGTVHPAGSLKYRARLFEGWLNYQGGRWGFHKNANENNATGEIQLYWPYRIDDAHPELENGDYYRNIEFFAMGNLPNNDRIQWHSDCPYYVYQMNGSLDNEQAMDDILCGAVVQQRKPTDGVNKAVEMTMHHAMAKIQYEYVVKNPNIEVVIENNFLYNVWRNASLSLAWDRTTDNNPAFWHTYSNPGNVERGDGWEYMNRLFLTADGESHYATFRDDENATYINENYRGKRVYDLVIPQSTNEQTASGVNRLTSGIKLWMAVKDRKGNVIKEEHGYSVALPNVTWLPGHVYTYKFIFEGDDWCPVINVQCTVANWTTEEWEIPVN